MSKKITYFKLAWFVWFRVGTPITKCWCARQVTEMVYCSVAMGKGNSLEHQSSTIIIPLTFNIMSFCSVVKQADADDLSATINAVLERVYDVVSENANLKNELNYTINRKPLEKAKKAKTRRLRKSPLEDLATKNSATENSAAENSVTVNSAAENSTAENSATEDPATENTENSATVTSATVNLTTVSLAVDTSAAETSTAENSATVNVAADKSAAEKLGDPVEEVDVADTRISKIFKYDLRQFSADFLVGNKCTQWLQDPSSFLEFDQTPHGQFAGNPQYSAILSIRKLEEQNTHSRILRRLYCIVFSIFQEVDSYEDAKTIATALYGHYYPGQPQCEKKLRQLTARIRDLEVAGRRYRDLISLFCTGAIFILGDDVSNST